MSETAGLDWVKRQQDYYKRPHQLTPEEERCVLVVCSLGMPYNLPIEWEKVEWRGRYIVVQMKREELATYDFAGLTNLVLSAHEHSVRVAISAKAAREPALQLMLHAREPWTDDGHMAAKHPTIEQAVARYRGAC